MHRKKYVILITTIRGFHRDTFEMSTAILALDGVAGTQLHRLVGISDPPGHEELRVPAAVAGVVGGQLDFSVINATTVCASRNIHAVNHHVVEMVSSACRVPEDLPELPVGNFSDLLHRNEVGDLYRPNWVVW